MTTISISKNLKKGQILFIDGFQFPIESDCEITFKGKDISDCYSAETAKKNGGIMIEKYCVQCEAIQINEKHQQSGYFAFDVVNEDGTPCNDLFCSRTATDIGGHHVLVGTNNDESGMFEACETLAFLHNSFGDGRYTLRFLPGKHIR